jgi:HAD superfamily phosphatase (TIGR01681 family)
MLFVFDLDLTITDYNYGESIDEAWEIRSNYNSLKQMLKKQKQNGHVLAILSRGVRRDVIYFLKKVKLLHLFNIVIGAKSIAENIDNSDFFWGNLKTRYLHALRNVYGDDLVFLDDMMYNIRPARKAGFQVIHVKPPGSMSTVKLIHSFLKKHPN